MSDSGSKNISPAEPMVTPVADVSTNTVTIVTSSCCTKAAKEVIEDLSGAVVEAVEAALEAVVSGASPLAVLDSAVAAFAADLSGATVSVHKVLSELPGLELAARIADVPDADMKAAVVAALYDLVAAHVAPEERDAANHVIAVAGPIFLEYVQSNQQPSAKKWWNCLTPLLKKK